MIGSRGLSDNALRYESNDASSADVADNPAGIGFVALPAVGNARALAVFESETVPLRATSFTVAVEDYLLSRRLYFYAPEQNLGPLARSFIEFVLSDAGQEVVRHFGYVSQALTASHGELPSTAPAGYRSLVSGAGRLSLNFRFRPGAVSLDSKGEKDLERIIEYLHRNEHLRVMLVGFADADEAPAAFAQELSIVRADYLASQLKRRGIYPTRVRGFGHDLPVASNAGDRGRQKNRRVEVWVYDRNAFEPPLAGLNKLAP